MENFQYLPKIKIINRKPTNLRLASSMSMSDMDDPRDMEDSELRVCSLPESEMLLTLLAGWWDIREWDCASGRNYNTEITYH